MVLSVEDKLLAVTQILFGLHLGEYKMFAFLKGLLNHDLEAASKNGVNFTEVEELNGLALVINEVDPSLASWEVRRDLRHHLNN